VGEGAGVGVGEEADKKHAVAGSRLTPASEPVGQQAIPTVGSARDTP